MLIPGDGGDQYRRAEGLLRANFVRGVGTTGLGDTVVFNPHSRVTQESRLPTERFSLVAITPPDEWGADRHTWLPTAYKGHIPEGISAEYYENFGDGGIIHRDSPFLDAGYGIGLAYEHDGKKSIVAVSSGGIYPNLGVPEDGNDAPTYVIKQVQGVVQKLHQPELSEALSHKSGIMWRNTLTRAHEAIARGLGIRRIAFVCDYVGNTPQHIAIRTKIAELAEQEGYRLVTNSTLDSVIYEKYLD